MGKRAEVGIVIPTLGTREHYLKECLDSLVSEGVFISVIGPSNSLRRLDLSKADFVLDDVGLPLAGAINKAIRSFPTHCEYVSWIGDDDWLENGSIESQINVFERFPSVVATFGQCQYVDFRGDKLIVQRSGKFASLALTWGPNLIPQPGGLFRRSAWERLGGLDETFSQAFDTDMFLRMRQIGELRYIPRVLANYRWHEGALSVGSRLRSVVESSEARKKNARNALTTIAPVDWVVRLATLLAGKLLGLRLKIGKLSG